MAFERHDKETGREMLAGLVAKFRENERYYKSSKYLEENCKAEFIDKMLIALNWDVGNESGVSPRFREVVFEAQSKGSKGTVNHPDYALCIGGNPVMFVEAKPPSVKVLDAGSHALQLREYAFGEKSPLSVLTDFEEFAVYDTRKKPEKGDDAGVARIQYITYDKYDEEFDYLWDTFSYDAVIHGSIDTYFENDEGKYKQNDVNEEMLEAIEEWRVLLVKSVEAKGWKVTEQNINTAVQRLINRMVYIWRIVGANIAKVPTKYL